MIGNVQNFLKLHFSLFSTVLYCIEYCIVHNFSQSSITSTYVSTDIWFFSFAPEDIDNNNNIKNNIFEQETGSLRNEKGKGLTRFNFFKVW